MPDLDKFSISCDDMMQELAEASVESILVGIDGSDSPSTSPETPPVNTKNNNSSEWYTSVATPFSSNAPSWSFGESSSDFSRQNSSLSDTGGATTVMLRNIPNKYTRAGLLAALVERGFDNPSIDCNNLYLPMDAGSGCNLGYCFLNFMDHERALEFKRQFDGCRLPSAGSRKVCTVVWANKQGLFQHSNPPSIADNAAQTASIAAIGIVTSKIFVGGLPTNSTEADLHAYFGKFGPIREVSIVTNRQTGASRGFGFCEFVYPHSVDQVQLVQSHSINCRVVSVRPYTASVDPPEPVSASVDYARHYSSSQYMPSPYVPHYAPVQSFLMGNGILQPQYPSFISYHS